MATRVHRPAHAALSDGLLERRAGNPVTIAADPPSRRTPVDPALRPLWPQPAAGR